MLSKKQRFFKSRVSRYSSCDNCITFQLLKDACLVRIMLSGDAHCNPGPDNSWCLGRCSMRYGPLCASVLHEMLCASESPMRFRGS